jgi:hypothetical protein
MLILDEYSKRFPTWLYNENYGHGYGEMRDSKRLLGWGVMTREAPYKIYWLYTIILV